MVTCLRSAAGRGELSKKLTPLLGLFSTSSLGSLTHLAALLLQPASALLLPLPTELGARLAGGGTASLFHPCFGGTFQKTHQSHNVV